MKKTWSILLVFSLLFTSAVSVFAADSESKELQNMILYVKSVISVPETFTEFSQSSRQEEQEDKSVVTIWDLNWSTEDKTENLSVSIDNKRNFMSYRLYKDKPEEEGLSKVTRQAGEKTALAFVKKMVPQYASYFKQVNETANQMNTYNMSYTFQPYVNGVCVRFIEASVYIDKHSGGVISFSLNNEPFDINKIPSKEGALSEEAAKKAYLETFGMDLNYYSYYDWDKDKLEVFPAYVNSSETNEAMDAKTGKAVKIGLPIILYGKQSAVREEAAVMDNAGGLTPKEQEQVDKVNGLISKERADSILRASFGEVGSASSLKASLQMADRNPNKGQYVWNLSYEKANGRVDAKSGEILSYYNYDEDTTKGTPKIDEKSVASIVESLTAKILSKEKLDSLKQTATEFNQDDIYATINYSRQVNGIDYPDNYIGVTVNRKTGKVISYHLSWYDGVTFPSIEGTMDEEKAYEVYQKLSDFSLNYEKIEKDGKWEASLVYNFDAVSTACMIHPESGIRLDQKGKAYKEEKGVPQYKDLQGHWSEAAVNQLKENGYYLEGDNFLPNKKITQKEFLLYSYPYYKDLEEDKLYEILRNDGIIKKGEENPNAELSRQDAAKFMIRFLRLQKAAEHPELFQNVFKDQVEYAYKGYATLSKGLGILSADSYGKFNGKNTMSRAEVASALHRLLNISN